MISSTAIATKIIIPAATLIQRVIEPPASNPDGAIVLPFGMAVRTQRHKGTKTQRKAANKSVDEAFLCVFVPLCLCVLRESVLRRKLLTVAEFHAMIGGYARRSGPIVLSQLEPDSIHIDVAVHRDPAHDHSELVGQQ